MSKVKENWEILILVCLFLAVKSFFLFKPHLMNWDESVYLAIGKYIWSWGGVGIWEKIRPLGLPLLLGFFWRLKLDYFLWAEVLINLFAAGNLILAYFIGKRLYHKYLGLAAGLVLGMTPVFFINSSLILTSIPSAFFSLTAIYFYLQGRNFYWVGFFSVLSFLFRFPQGLLLAVFLILIWFRENNKFKKTVAFLGGYMSLFLVFLMTNYFLYKDQVSNVFHALFRPLILGSMHQGNIFNAKYSLFYFKELFFQNYLLVFSLLGLVFIAVNWKKHKKWPVIALSGIVYLGYFTYITNKQLRFSLVFLPYFCLLAGLGFFEFWELLKKRKAWNLIFIAVVLVLVVFSLVPAVKTNYKNYIWRPDYEHPIVWIYKYPDFEGRILTGNPIPAAYLDRSFVSFYQDPPTAMKTYELEKGEVGHIVYFEQFYPCWNKDCSKEKKELFDEIGRENELIMSTSMNSQDFYFFKAT